MKTQVNNLLTKLFKRKKTEVDLKSRNKRLMREYKDKVRDLENSIAHAEEALNESLLQPSTKEHSVCERDCYGYRIGSTTTKMIDVNIFNEALIQFKELNKKKRQKEEVESLFKYIFDAEPGELIYELSNEKEILQ